MHMHLRNILMLCCQSYCLIWNFTWENMQIDKTFSITALLIINYHGTNQWQMHDWCRGTGIQCTRYSTTICKSVDLILALHQSDCWIPNWVSAKTVHSSSTNHGQTTACIQSFFRVTVRATWPKQKRIKFSWPLHILFNIWVISLKFKASLVHIFVISFIQRHIITCKLHG